MHFLMLTLLMALSLIGFTAATCTITDANGNMPIELSMVFAALTLMYVLFFNFFNGGEISAQFMPLSLPW
jgi:hypothetical protein